MNVPATPTAAPEAPPASASRRTMRGVCSLDCPDACALLVEVEGDKVVRVHGDPAHPVTRGFLCNKVNRYDERVNHADRLLYPQIRVGPKGGAVFRRASWDEALDLVARRVNEIVARHGGEALLPYHYAGTMGILQNGAMDRRFFHRLGASRLDETICSAAGSAGMQSAYGVSKGVAPEAIPQARLVVLWGANVLATSIHDWPFIEEARKSGAPLVVIDPLRTPTAERADWHIRPRPGTDAALALAVAHEVFAHDWHDEPWLEAHALGWREYRERAATCPPERAEAITGIAAADIRRLATMFGAKASRPAHVRLNFGLNRHANGATITRAVGLLPALFGDWSRIGGGARLSTSGGFGLNRAALARPDLEPGPTRIINMIDLGDALTGDLDPPVAGLFVYSANPGASNPDQRKVLAGLAREDLFTVVHEQFLTDTARFADVLLPSTMQMEQSDLHFSWGHYHLQLNRPAVSAPGECRPLYDVFTDLARRVGLTDPCFSDSFDDLIDQAIDAPSNPRLVGITRARLEAERSVPLAPLDDRLPFYSPYLDAKFDTPSGKVEFVSSKFKAMGLDPVLGPLTADEVHPETAAERARWPLHFLTPASKFFMNSSLVENDRGRRMAQGPLLHLTPEDAAPRGIKTGDLVRVANDRGAWTVRAQVDDLAMPGVVVSFRGWWSRWTEQGGNANQTTSQRKTDAGGGPAFYTNFVEVERVS